MSSIRNQAADVNPFSPTEPTTRPGHETNGHSTLTDDPIGPSPENIARSSSAPDEASPGESPRRQRQLTTVAQVLAWFLAHGPKVHPMAQKERRRILSMFAEVYGTLRVDELVGEDLVNFVAQQDGVKAAHSIARWYRTLRQPFNLAEQMGLIFFRPFRRIRLPRGAQGRDVTNDEYRTILRSARPEFRRVLIFLRFSGCRPGEARVAEWQHVRTDGYAIVLPKDLHKTGKRTGKSRRIRLNRVLVKLLMWLRRRALAGHGQPQPHGKIFLNSYGKPWTIRALCHSLAKLREMAGLPTDVKLYGCRHAYATWALLHDVDLKTLAELLGHESTKTTEWYTHLAGKDDHMSKAAERAVAGGVFRSAEKSAIDALCHQSTNGHGAPTAAQATAAKNGEAKRTSALEPLSTDDPPAPPSSPPTNGEAVSSKAPARNGHEATPSKKGLLRRMLRSLWNAEPK